MTQWNGSRALAVVGAILLCSPVAYAGGFYLTEIGTPGSIATAGTGNTVQNRMADSSWANPAGMTGLDESAFMVGFMILYPVNEFELTVATAGGGDGGNAGVPAAIPSLFYVRPIGEGSMRFGVSLVAPFGGGYDYGSDWAGRYSLIENSITGLSVSPALAGKIGDNWSIGGGVSIVLTIFNQEIARNQIGADGLIEFDGLDDVGFQPFISVNREWADGRGLFSIVYRAELDVDLSGDINFKNLNLPLMDRKLEISWANPQWLEAGVKVPMGDEWSILANANWQEWSAFSDNVITIADGPMGEPITAVLDRNWDDTWSVGIAAAKDKPNGVTYGFGASYDSSVVDSADRTIDLPLTEITRLSGGWGKRRTDKFDYGFGGTLYIPGSGNLSQTNQGETIAGEFDTNIIFIVGGAVRF